MTYYVRVLLGVMLAPILYNRYLYLIGLILAFLNPTWIFAIVLISLLKTSLLVQDNLLANICTKIIETYKIRYSIEQLNTENTEPFEPVIFSIKINGYEYVYKQFEQLSNIYEHNDYVLRFVVIRWCFQIFRKREDFNLVA